jgi:electron transfer flavoprotein alpha/beta subunit
VAFPHDARTTVTAEIPLEVTQDGRLGPYRLIREIGHGGMGTVYLGVRADDAYQKRVAIKVLKRGMDTDHVLARFRAERQILASLDHANIARLVDGGSTDEGLPYLVMEYIDGQPIDAWADEHRLPVADRLRLPLISQVAELTVSDDKLRGKRQTEFGYDVIEAPLPAVVAVSDAINVPRYPALKGIMGAKKKPQEILSLGDLGVDSGEAGEAGSRTEVYALGDPPARGDTVKIEDDGSGAEKIVQFLLEKKAL